MSSAHLWNFRTTVEKIRQATAADLFKGVELTTTRPAQKTRENFLKISVCECFLNFSLVAHLITLNRDFANEWIGTYVNKLFFCFFLATQTNLYFSALIFYRAYRYVDAKHYSIKNR